MLLACPLVHTAFRLGVGLSSYGYGVFLVGEGEDEALALGKGR